MPIDVCGEELWQALVKPLKARIRMAASVQRSRAPRSRRRAMIPAHRARRSVPQARITRGRRFAGPRGPCICGGTDAAVVVHEKVTIVLAAVPSIAGSVPVDPLVKPIAVLVKLHDERFGSPEALSCTLAGNCVFAVVGMMVSTVMAPPPGVTVWLVGLSEIMKSVPTPNAWLLLGPPAVFT